ncbi:MAG: hypothetical protein K2K46_04545 [Lachnospiraceae bacterium]|nr:hypothetical protein [Lachnospiraceae bacterium]
MIDPVFFDTDCLCSFLWVGKEGILPLLYPGRITIPHPVYTELSNPRIPHLKNRLDSLLSENLASIQGIDINSEEFQTYFQLTEAPAAGHAIIGNGEASAIALAKSSHGIVASNNLSDITAYIEKFNLKNITTGDILTDALEKELIDEAQGNIIWTQMLSKRRRLGASSFTEYLKKHIAADIT